MSNKQLYEKENNINKPFFPVVRLEDIIDTISEKSIQWILNNYNHIYVEWKNDVVGTRLSVPTILRRNGLWITYNNGDRLITEYYIGKNTEIKDKHWQDDTNWEDYTNKLIDGTVEYKHLSENLKQLFNKGNITNFPDEEDLTSDGVALSFKDREYQPENFSGLGRVILRKNIIKIGEEYKNILTQSMVNKENTIYEIRYNFDLNGEEITIPEGCVLDFQGGILNNGGIIGNNTCINNKHNVVIFNNIFIAGIWNVQTIYSAWFLDLSKDNDIKNIFAFTNDNIKNVVYINKQSYDYIVSFKNIHESCIQIPSNTEIIIDGVIRVRGNDLNGYRVFFINNKENIIIRGNGNIIGDFYEDNEIIPNTGKHDLNGIQEYGGHAYTTHEYCHAIVSYDSKKINLQNITISRFPGDALALGNDYMDIHNQIIVENCELYKCRRQGISIIGHNYIIRNNHIHDIKGTAPQSAIDIEPNNNINTCSNILIENNIIENCEYGICIVGSNGEINSVKISNNTVKAQNPIYSAGKDNKNIIIENNIIFAYKEYSIIMPKINNLYIKNNTINAALYHNPGCQNVIIENNDITLNASSVLNITNGKIINNKIENILENSIQIFLIEGDNISIENNYYNNGWLKSNAYRCKISNNIIEYDALNKSTNMFNGEQVEIKNNKFYVTAKNEENLVESIINFDVVKYSQVYGNIFNFDDWKVSYPILISVNSNKISIENNQFNATSASRSIMNRSQGEIIIKGLYSNFRENNDIPAYSGSNNDIQAKQVTYINKSDNSMVISNGTGNQFNALGKPINTKYQVEAQGFIRPSANDVFIGMSFFDKSITPARPIYVKNINNENITWVDATGQEI